MLQVDLCRFPVTVGRLLCVSENGELAASLEEVDEISAKNVKSVIQADGDDRLWILVRSDGEELGRQRGKRHLAHQIRAVRPKNETAIDVGKLSV